MIQENENDMTYSFIRYKNEDIFICYQGDLAT